MFGCLLLQSVRKRAHRGTRTPKPNRTALHRKALARASNLPKTRCAIAAPTTTGTQQRLTTVVASKDQSKTH